MVGYGSRVGHWGQAREDYKGGGELGETLEEEGRRRRRGEGLG